MAIVGAVIGLAILGRLALSGIGPFDGHVGNVVSVPPGLAVTLTVTNKGTSAGSTTCRIYDAGSTGLGPDAAFIVSPPDRPGRDGLVLEGGHGPRQHGPPARGRVHRAVTAGDPTAAMRSGPSRIHAGDGESSVELAFATDLAVRAGRAARDRLGRVERSATRARRTS